MPSREFEEYRKEKQQEAMREDQPAKAEHDPAREKETHLDPLRSSHRKGGDDTPRDAEGQAEHGRIEQTVTNRGYTQSR